MDRQRPPPLSAANLNDISNALAAANITQAERAAIGASATDTVGACMTKIGAGLKSGDVLISTRNPGTGFIRLDGTASAGSITGFPRPFELIPYSTQTSNPATYYNGERYEIAQAGEGYINIMVGANTYRHLTKNGYNFSYCRFITLGTEPYAVVYNSYQKWTIFTLPMSQAKSTTAFTVKADATSARYFDFSGNCITIITPGTTVSMQTINNSNINRSTSLTNVGTSYTPSYGFIGANSAFCEFTSSGNSAAMFIRGNNGFIRKPNGSTAVVLDDEVYYIYSHVLYDANDNPIMAIPINSAGIPYKIDIVNKRIYTVCADPVRCGDYSGFTGGYGGVIYKYDGYPVIGDGWLKV